MAGTGRSRWDVRRVLLEYELRMVLRDTRTVLITVVAPLVLFPGLIWLMRTVEQREERRLDEATYRYAVVGDSAGWARATVRDALGLGPADTAGPLTRFEEVGLAGDVSVAGGALDSILDASNLHVIVRGMSRASFQALRAAEEAEREAEEEAEEEEREEGAEDEEEAEGSEEEYGPGVPAIRLEFRVDSDFGRRAASVLSERLQELRRVRRDSVFRARGFPVDPGAVAEVEPANTASAEREAGAVMGLALTPFLMLLMLTGGSIVAADAISGEKERGTLETLLTTAARRSEIVQAKLAAVVVVGLVVALVNLLNLLVYVVFGVLELPAALAVDLSPLDLGLLLVLLAPVTVLVGSALLLLSGYAKSYKEYQIYFFPLFLLLLAPSLAAVLPGMDLRSVVALVPVSGVAVAVSEVMVGEYDWPFLALAFLSTGWAAWWLAGLTERALSTERLVSEAELDEADLVGGPALFPRHVLRWFAVMWAAFFIASAWAGEQLGVRGQIVLNLVVIFFGASVLMIRHYRLPLREALALRPVPPSVWLAVLVGAPSALLVAVGLAELVDAYVFPVPERLVEAFNESLLGEDLPLWQTVLFLAVMPGFFEEIAFRGLLLHGLRKHLRPVALCVAVGAVFALFHVSLFRIVPTAYLGALLAGVVVLTGSIYPAMLWHALNNLMGILPSELGWVDAETAFPWWSYAVAVLGVVAAFRILWIARRPYPGIRGGALDGDRTPVDRNVHGAAGEGAG